jgi:2'-phosphotransferase
MRRIQPESSDPRTQLSKKFSWALRHGIHELGIEISAAGYVKVQDLLAHPKFRSIRLEQMKEMVATSERQFFTLKEEGGELYIRANQGHTVKVPSNQVDSDELFTPLTDPHKFPLVIHGTCPEPWDSIRRRGLYTMGRNNIRRLYLDLTMGMPKCTEFGPLTWTVLIEIDVGLAMSEGVKFYKSPNDVILTPGINGYLSPVT